jgi:transposase
MTFPCSRLYLRGSPNMLFTMNEPIWFHPAPIDFRKQIDGLIVLVADQLALNPASGQLFVFRDRTGRKIKMLWWDRNGFWLFSKRMEKGRLIFPRLSETVMSLTRDQLSWLLSGLNCLMHTPLPVVEVSNFY